MAANKFSLFGFTISRKEDENSQAVQQSFTPPVNTILRLLNYNQMAQDVFRRYYVDGRLYYHIIVDREAPTDGIKELRYIDPRKIRKVREVKKSKDERTGVEVANVINEYYIFNDKVISYFTSNGIIYQLVLVLNHDITEILFGL